MYRKSNIADCREIYDLICQLEQKTLSYQRFYEIYKEQLEDSNLSNKFLGIGGVVIENDTSCDFGRNLFKYNA